MCRVSRKLSPATFKVCEIQGFFFLSLGVTQSLICSAAGMIHTEYHKVASIHHLPVANLNGTLRMAASGGAAQFNFIIICFKVLQIVPQLCRRIRKYQNQGAIVIPHTALLALDGRRNNLSKSPLRPTRNSTYSFSKSNVWISDSTRSSAFQKSGTVRCPKKLTVNRSMSFSLAFSDQQLPQVNVSPLIIYKHLLEVNNPLIGFNYILPILLVA